MNKGPVDRVRNSAVVMTLPPNAGGIQEMCEINGALHMLGTKAIYCVQLADQIDPQRTNIALPNVHQQVVSYGTDFAYVRQTLMQAKRLFKDRVLGPDFDYKGGIDLSFDVLKDLTIIYEIQLDLCTKLANIKADLKDETIERRSMHVPSLGNVRGMTETFLQKADHIALDLFKIVKLFYGHEIGKGMFEGLRDLIATKFGDEDQFSQFLKMSVPFLKFVRNSRNAIEHEDETKRVNVIDISLLPSGELNEPQIEIIHKETPQPPVPLLILMEKVTDQLARVFEVMIAHLCGVRVQSYAGIPLGVVEYEENLQEAFKCRYGYATLMGDQIVPFG